MEIQKKLFDQLDDVRYVAVYRCGDPSIFERSGICDASDSASDRFEELLVNPTILLLAKQRGNIDCGGLEYVLIRYGNFFQFVMPLKVGHISIAIEPTANLVDTVAGIRAIVAAWESCP